MATNCGLITTLTGAEEQAAANRMRTLTSKPASIEASPRRGIMPDTGPTSGNIPPCPEKVVSELFLPHSAPTLETALNMDVPAADQREHEIAADTTVILREWVDLVPSGFSRQPTVGFRMLRPRNTRKTAAGHPIAV
jgi:hypothetical protein